MGSHWSLENLRTLIQAALVLQKKLSTQHPHPRLPSSSRHHSSPTANPLSIIFSDLCSKPRKPREPSTTISSAFMICVVWGDGSCFVLFYFLLWKILWQEKKANYCSDGIGEAGAKVQEKNHPREMCKSGKPYLRVPSKRVAMVSRKVFWGASNPFITGIFPALCKIPHQSLSRRMALKESTKLGEVT